MENCLTALRAVRANPLRSVLTMLGIIIGVGAVIVMLAIGEGAHAKVAEQIRSLGSNLIFVRAGSTQDGGVNGGAGSGSDLTAADAAAIAAAIPSVIVSAPSLAGTGQIVRGNLNWNTLIAGITPAYLVARDWRVADGRPLTEADEIGAKKVVLLGTTVAKRLFDAEDPVGQSVRIQSVPFRVVGVLSEKGVGTGRDQDDVVLVPFSTAMMRVTGSRSEVRRDAVDFILVKAASDDAVPTVTASIRSLLRQRHATRPGVPDPFEITEPAAMMEAQAAATRSLSLLLLVVASVSVVVGGISIMNIMLVSVTERTREIGLRQALGARPSEVRNQFLVEAVILCLIGGLLGTAGGLGVTAAIAVGAEWPMMITPESILLALGFSAGTGLFFGYYPARRAAALSPLEALRFE